MTYSVVKNYECGTLYDMSSALLGILSSVTRKFPGDDIDVVVEVAHVVVKSRATIFPWLFYSELDKAVRTWNAQYGVTNTFAAVEVEDNVCYVNRFVLLDPDFEELPF